MTDAIEIIQAVIKGSKHYAAQASDIAFFEALDALLGIGGVELIEVKSNGIKFYDVATKMHYHFYESGLVAKQWLDEKTGKPISKPLNDWDARAVPKPKYKYDPLFHAQVKMALPRIIKIRNKATAQT